LLHTYGARCVMMGDPHQRWNGRISEPRLGSAKPLAMSQSLRTGQHAEKWIRDTLSYSPIAFPDHRQFRGAFSHSTRVLHAQTYDQLPHQGLCVFANCWELLEAVQKLAHGQGSFSLVPASEADLKKIVQNAYDLLVSEGADTFAGEEVDGCHTKEALIERLLEGGYGRVLRMFERGFTPEDLKESLARKTVKNAKHVLTLMVHAKNMEFGKAWLSPGLFQEFNRKRPNSEKHLYGVREATHLLYLGMTRCRDELRLPGDALDKLKDIAKKRTSSETKTD
jgi:hypothetical protein